VFPLTDGMPPRRFPVVNVAIIAACFAVWIFYELPHLRSSVDESAFYTCDVTGSCDASLPWAVSWFTAMFMHGSWSHILGNMWYVAGGLAATVAQGAVTVIAGTRADEMVPMLGASGAIAAVLGAYFVLFPKARILTLVVVFPVRIPAWVFLGLWFLYQVIGGHMGVVSGSDEGGGTAFFAHMGGFIFGVGAAMALKRSGRRGEKRLPAVGRV
jgi:membrane associated rhomboid family serine protease